jgi:RNA polymerase sigma-70 factor (ECF subfamily)
MDEAEQRDLAQGLREGKAEAWRTLYEAYAEPVWRSVARLLGPSSADVADVVQETFLAAAHSACTYDPVRGSLWQWLWGIARRHVALHYRKQQRHDRLRQASLWLHAGNGRLQRWLAGSETAPADALAAAELATLVRATLKELPADYESLLTAKYLDGDSVETIASRERSTAVAIRSKLARARQAFRQIFARYGPAEIDSHARDPHETTG